MNILHRDTEPSFRARLSEMLRSAARADIAVGYFFINGFEQIADDLSQLQRARILVGRTDRQVFEEVAAGLQQQRALKAQMETQSIIQRRDRPRVARQPVDHIARGVSQLPQRDADQAAVQTLRDLIASGAVELRAYLRSPLHAKAYLCWYDGHAEPGSAVVGSSNLTLAGFEANTELNVRVTGDDEMAALSAWFDALWADAEDIGDQLLQELDRSWAIARTPPWHVYLKALRELYDSANDDADLVPLRDATPLANFQLDAVRQGLSMIETHGGCYIGDVVGLGKSYIGAELLRQLAFSYPSDGKPLILCPAGLIPMWQRIDQQFQLGAAILSHHMIAEAGNPDFDEELGRYIDAEPPQRGIVLQDRYPNNGPVLIDEAHNFRNENQRSRGLRQYLSQGDHKVVLMSATPQNLGPMDIYRQLLLFLDDLDHGLPIEPLSLKDYFHNAAKWLEYRLDNENSRAEQETGERDRLTPSPPLPPKQPAVPHARIEEVLGKVFIRRRRRDIRELYGDSAEINGQPIRFPKPSLDNVDYRLDRVYERAGSFEQISRALRRHQASRYRHSAYLTDAARTQERYQDLLRSRDRLSVLIKAQLVKRLESSVAAFRSTLHSLMRSNRHFREALEQGYVPVGKLATRMLSGQSFDAEEALEILSQEDDVDEANGRKHTRAHPTRDFHAEQWIADLDADHQLLSDLYQRAQAIEPEDDDKLRALREFLDRPDVAAGKLLIFSEAETTIDYLYEQLNPDGRNRQIARLTGRNRKEAQDIVQRFSPDSNPPPGGRRIAAPIRILLATDVVSEGQNLQDCARVLNYDLHWNPVRLIQRFGRVDRIGTRHAAIHLHNMWPDLEVDKDLDLTDQIGRRVQLVHDLIGLDTRLLSHTEKLNSEEMYRIYGDAELPDADDGLDDVSVHQRAVATLQRIREQHPDLWRTIEQLPDGIRSALTVAPTTQASTSPAASSASPAEPSQPALIAPAARAAYDPPAPAETLVLLAAGQLRSCYAVDDNLQPRPITHAQFAAAAECDPDTPSQPLPPQTNERVMAAFNQFTSEYGRRLGRTRRIQHGPPRRYVLRQLDILRNQSSDSDADRIDPLRRIFAGPLPTPVERALADIQRIRPSGPALLARLEGLREDYRLSPQREPEPAPGQPQIIRIVCSDGLIG